MHASRRGREEAALRRYRTSPISPTFVTRRLRNAPGSCSTMTASWRLSSFDITSAVPAPGARSYDDFAFPSRGSTPMTDPLARILVADDEADLRALLQRYLTDQGYAVRTVESAGPLDKLLAREPFDVLVLDVMMPG